jgi:hypothetical protein
VFGHQKLSLVLVTNTYGTEAVAALPLTVTPVKPPTVTVDPETKFVPYMVIARLVVTPYVTDDRLRLVTLSGGETTVKPFVRLADRPPSIAGLVTWTVYDPGANDVFGHQNLSDVLLTCTNGVATLALNPTTVGPDRLPTVIVAPGTKFDPEIVTSELPDTP